MVRRIIVFSLLFLACSSLGYSATESVLGGFMLSARGYNTAKAMVVPVLVRAKQISAFKVGVFTPASMAIIAGAVLQQVYAEDSASFPALKGFLASMSITSTPAGSYTITVPMQTPIAGSNFETCINTWVAQYGVGSLELKYFLTDVARGQGETDAGFTKQCSGTRSNYYPIECVYGGQRMSIGGSKYLNVYNSNAGFGDCVFAGQSDMRFLYAFGVTSADVVTEYLSTYVSIPSIQGRLEAALKASGAVLDDARKGVLDVFDWINKAILTNNPALDRPGLQNKTIRQVVTEQAKTGVGQTAWDEPGGEADQPENSDPGSTVTDDAKKTGDNIKIIQNETTMINAPSTVNAGSSEFVPVPYAPSSPLSAFVAGDHDLVARTEQFVSDIQQSPFVSMISGFAGAVPSGGSCEVSVNGGIFGTHVFSFCDLGFVWSVLRAVCLCVAGYVGLRIVTRGGGG